MLSKERLDVLDTLLELSELTDLQQTVLQNSWEGKTYQEIAIELGYDSGYIRDIGSKVWRILSKEFGIEVTKNNFRSVIQRGLRTGVIRQVPSNQETPLAISSIDWGNIPDVLLFYGREQELAQISQWIEENRCRVVGILGMGGIGKTSLARKLAQNFQARFDYIIWRSLCNAPPVRNLVADLLGVLGHLYDKIPWKDDLDYNLTQLIVCLRQHRCLLILDNFETILCSHERTGHYREGYEDYGLLLNQIAQLPGASQMCKKRVKRPVYSRLLLANKWGLYINTRIRENYL
ncbi:hypothetical protein H6G93_38165, partial [Nostoc sp. FACHB-973]|nr:hypothetical protein [Nostoc sp. FACHB-973]